MKRAIRATAALFALIAWAFPARATPTIAVDLDLSTPGIQSSLTVSLGTLFTVGIVYESDRLTLFDAIELGVAFNDAGTVLGLGPGVTPGDPRFGALAGEASDFVQERGSFDAAFVGEPMHPFGIFTPPPNFADGVGPFGYSVAHPGIFTPELNRPITVLTVTFEALFPGNSAVCPEPLSPFLFLDGIGVEAIRAGGMVRVSEDGSSAPAPATLLLLSAGLAGLAFARKKL